MPVVITLPDPGVVGPGIQIQVNSDFIGPLPVGSYYQLNFSTDAEGANVAWQEIWSTTSPNSFVLLGQPRAAGHADRQHVLTDGQQVWIHAELHENTSAPVDTGTRSTTWAPTVMAWRLTSNVSDQIAARPPSGGLTTEQAQQLTDTERRTQLLGEPIDLLLDTASGTIQATLAQIFSRKTLDQLTLFEVTSGPTCDPVRATVSTWATAVIVRVTRIGEDLTPRTPDLNWYFPDLAVLRIFRGVDLQYRRGIHTPTFMVEQPWQWSWQFLNELQVLGNPPDINLAVDWRVGCCGQVFLMSLP